jgi:hypothetical protein
MVAGAGPAAAAVELVLMDASDMRPSEGRPGGRRLDAPAAVLLEAQIR